MLKFIGAITCGIAAATIVAYFAMRPNAQRTSDVESAKKMYNGAINGVRNYFSQLFQPKADPQTPIAGV